MKTFVFTYIGLFLICCNLFAQGSSKKKKKKNYVTQQVSKDLLTAGSRGEFYFDFRNVNRVAYYRDKSKLEYLKKLEEKKDQERLLSELEKYVAHFGIENFYKDTRLLWKLAELYELNGLKAEAKSTYRLILKHHPKRVFEEIQQYYKAWEHYDTLTALEQDYFVPLDYYYELVEYRRAVDTLRPPKSVFLNMGENINARRIPEYAPSMNASDDFLIFTKKTYNPRVTSIKPVYTENLYYSQLYDGDFWDEAQPFEWPIQSNSNEGSACISPDGKTLFFARCLTKYSGPSDCNGCLGDCDLFVSTLDTSNKWSTPINLGKNVNSKSWDSQPSLSRTGDTLFFASARPGGFGLTDIYFTYKKSNGTWTKAQNMGPVINTRDSEYSPFYSRSHDVFYFSSNGHILNFDEFKKHKKARTLDIYKSHKVGKNMWGEPKNIGPLVNSEGNEFYFSIDSKSKNLFYAKTEDKAKDHLTTDLYSFPLPMGAQPTATIRLKGELVDEETGKPYEGIVSVIDLDNGIEIAPKRVREDGTYEFDLIDHNNYLLVVQGDDFFRLEKLFYLDGDTTIQTKAESVHKKLQFASVVFEGGKADIREEMELDLKKVLDFLIDNPNFHLTISGHTDSDGNEKANLDLSQQRADAIRKHLMEKGKIDGKRIKAIGYGSSQPIKTPEETEEDKRINRRVEFDIERNNDE
ncbi:MAG: OmpA family protein [Cytophagales bacterium]|nr:OmpA family protein [Cytophagales bacterium]